jgi:hypothetical protein
MKNEFSFLILLFLNTQLFCQANLLESFIEDNITSQLTTTDTNLTRFAR